MYQYGQKRKDPTIKVDGSKTFSEGLSQAAHPTAIKASELAEAQNAMYIQNGVVEKRPGFVIRGEIGEGEVSPLFLGSIKIGTDRSVYKITSDGILKKYIESSNIWSVVSGAPTWTKETNVLQGWGWVVFYNDTDDLTAWDGTSWITYDLLADPDTAPTVEKQGSGTGYTTYHYRYVWYNEAGHTVASPLGTLANMPLVLDATTYIKITVPAAPAGADTVAIFRTTGTADECYLDSIPASQTVYLDKGELNIDGTYPYPTENTTAGMHFKYAVVYKDAIVGVAVETGDDTIVSSAGLDEFLNFAPSYGASFFSWLKQDDDEIRGLHSYKEKLYIFKRNKIGAFSFLSDGGSKVEEISLAAGALSHDSIHSAGNEVRYFGPEGPMTLGYEANYGDVVRTRVVGAKAQTIIDTLTSQDEKLISSIFYKGISMWGIVRGSAGDGVTSTLTLNERFAAWSEWVGFKPKKLCKFVDGNNKERLFFTNPTDGGVYEAWEGKNDNGVPITFRLTTKQYNQDSAYAYKTYSKIYYIFGNVSGGNTKIVYIKDGYERSAQRVLYLSRSGRIGFGVDKWGTIAWGESSGSYSSDVSGINVRFIDLNNQEMFSIQTEIVNDGLDDIVQIMSIYIEYADSTLPLPGSYELPINYT